MIDWKSFKHQANGNPKKVLGFAVGLATCFFVMWAFVLAKSEINSGSATSIVSDTIVSDTLAASNAEYAPSQQIKELKGSREEPSLSSGLWPVALLLGLMILALWFFAKKKKAVSETQFMNLLGTQQVGVNQQLSLVHINEEYWVLGITNGQVSLLHRYDKEEWKGDDHLLISKKEEQELHHSFLALLKREEQNA